MNDAVPHRTPPASSFKYAEELYARELELQSDTLAEVSSAASTSLAALLAVGSLLFSYAQLKGHLPEGVWLWGALGGILVAGLLLGVAWIAAFALAESNILHAAVDLLVYGRSEEIVRESVVRRMIEVYASRRESVRLSSTLIAVAIPTAALGVSMFIYGAAR